MDNGRFVLDVHTNDIVKDLENLRDLFDFVNLDKNYKPFSIGIKKVLEKFKKKNPKKIWINEIK